MYGDKLTTFTKDNIRTISDADFFDLMLNKVGDGQLWTDKQTLMSKTNNENYLNSHLRKFPLHDIGLNDTFDKNLINHYSLSNNGKKGIRNYTNDLFIIPKEDFQKYSNVIVNNTNCTNEDVEKYNKFVKEGLLKELQYSNDKIYNNNQSFTNDWDGISYEYIEDGITLSYYLKHDKEKSQNDEFVYVPYSGRTNFELNHKTYIREPFDFKQFCENGKLGTDNIVEDVVLPSLRCYDDKTKEHYSLVLNEKFNNSDEGAIMFLECFRHHDMKHFMKVLFDGKNQIIYTTKVCALILGGYFKCIKFHGSFDGKTRLDKSDDIDEFTNLVWNNLNPDNKTADDEELFDGKYEKPEEKYKQYNEKK